MSPQLGALAHELQQLHAFERTFLISALTGQGLPALRACMVERAVQAPWRIKPGYATDQTPVQVSTESVKHVLHTFRFLFLCTTR